MKPSDVLAILGREVAPVALSDELCAKYGAYDNSGIILDCGSDVTGALFCLDLTAGAVMEAESRGYNLIVTHHPAIYSPVKSLGVQPHSPTAPLLSCAMKGISVISMHLNFDSALKGIDYYLMRGLGGEREECFLNPLSSGGYGRVYAVSAQSFADFSSNASREFESDKIRFYDANGEVKKIASFCGAGCDEEAIEFALSHGADTFVSADMKHHHVAALVWAGLNVVEMTHYCSEVYGFARIYASLNGLSGIPSAFYKEKILL